MQAYRTTLKFLASVCALAASVWFGAARADAAGTLVIRHANGHVDTYKDVAIKVIRGALYLTSKDGKGTLIVHRAACSYQGRILVCFTTGLVLVQAGKTRPLDLKTGTAYFNTTDEPQQLVSSSAKVPPQSVLLSLSTDIGTYVSVNGRIDQVVK
jgi:hypothetical protein